jgi:DNA-binding IclR family transcriptional regulator
VGPEDPFPSAVKSLRKALAILTAVATIEPPPTIAEIALRTGLARATAHRLVQTLIAEGHLEQEPVNGRLGIGYSVLPLAASLLDRNRMRLEALPRLNALAQDTQQRTNLGILHQNRLLYLAGVEKPSLPTLYSRFGRMAPAHSCSLGKAILANLPDFDIKALVVAQPLVAETPHTITNLRALTKELAATRERGYAIDRQERVIGTYCIAVPIFDAHHRAVGAIGLSGQSLDPLLSHVDAVKHTAELVSHSM